MYSLFEFLCSFTKHVNMSCFKELHVTKTCSCSFEMLLLKIIMLSLFIFFIIIVCVVHCFIYKHTTKTSTRFNRIWQQKLVSFGFKAYSCRSKWLPRLWTQPVRRRMTHSATFAHFDTTNLFANAIPVQNNKTSYYLIWNLLYVCTHNSPI